MALKHVRAAQMNAKTSDPLGRLILLVIATDIGYNGEPAYPSLSTIAARAGCHRNSAHNWVKRLVEAGDLIAERDGRQTRYTLGCDDSADTGGVIVTSRDVIVTSPCDDSESSQGATVTPQDVTITPQSVTIDSEQSSQAPPKSSQADGQSSQETGAIVTSWDVTQGNKYLEGIIEGVLRAHRPSNAGSKNGGYRVTVRSGGESRVTTLADVDTQTEAEAVVQFERFVCTGISPTELPPRSLAALRMMAGPSADDRQAGLLWNRIRYDNSAAMPRWKREFAANWRKAGRAYA